MTSPTPAARLSVALADRYRFERELGSGGMATVYLAEDLKHDRKVAIKVLKPELAAVLGAERFVVEIKTTASLSHPHILPLFDSGTADGFLFYVMPFIEGETIRDKLNRESQFGIEEAIRIAHEVADALDYAHRHGVIHRDIKPENLLLHDGRAMVMDFGIALALSAAAGGRMTETGLSLGTPHYMSPEQATADKDLTPRSDIYSLASVLYEMLAGQPPHVGGTAQQVIMKILTEEAAPVTRARRSVPVHVAAALAKALEKLPADRFETAKAFADALHSPGFTHATTGVIAQPTRIGAAFRPTRNSLALVAASAVAAAALTWFATRNREPAPVIRYTITQEPLTPEQDYGTNFAISPDGETVVLAMRDARGVVNLHVRRRSQLGLTPLPGGENAHQPFFSPDGKRVGFVTITRALRVVDLEGGTPITLGDSGISRGGGAWGDDGYIYASKSAGIILNASFPGGLIRFPEKGGPAEPVSRLDSAAQEVGHSFPAVLPGSRGVAFVDKIRELYRAENSQIAVVDLKTGKHKRLMPGVAVRWSPTGHLLVIQADHRLVAVPFDPKSLEQTGAPFTVADGVIPDALGSADLDISESGRLMYATGGVATGAFRPVWMSRDGQMSPVDTGWSGAFTDLAVSPDGTTLAVQTVGHPNGQIWLKRLGGGPPTRFTFGEGSQGNPTWSGDSRNLIYLIVANGVARTYARPADGSAPARLLMDVPVVQARLSRDGEWLVYIGPQQAVYARRMSGSDTTPRQLVPGRSNVLNIALSPNGRWLAYTATETGAREVFVRPFPDTGATRWQVSTAGGLFPLWSTDSRELYFFAAGRFVAAELQPGPVFGVKSQRPLSLPITGISGTAGLDAAPDGRFIGLRAVEMSIGAAREIVVVENFADELRARPKR